MRLLIVTQAVDSNDPVLGFFHGWLEEFARHFASVEVICLKEGEHHVPQNVRVHSLGKDRGAASRAAYAFRFLSLAWHLRHDYDAVFVHMNQEYVLIAGWLWELLGKRIYLWRNHAKGSWKTRMAGMFSEKVFYTSSQSYTAIFKNSVRMPVGIDTEFFKPDLSVQKKPHSVLFLGRIAPVKNVGACIDACNELYKQGIAFSATIAGSALPQDQEYEKMVQTKTSEYGLCDTVQFIGPVSQEEARALYQEHQIYMNLTPSGSMDKTIFEAMACGVTPLVFNQDFKGTLGEDFVASTLDSVSLAGKIAPLLAGRKGDHLRDFVVNNHSLKLLAGKFKSVIVE